jgi:threonine dehydrogenase-like Zn-dependent dehydrogenase
VPAVYGGFVDKFPMGAFMEKGLTMKTGQTHVQHYMPGLLSAILDNKVDTTFLISHHLPLENAPEGYKLFHDHQNETTKIVLKPGQAKVEVPMPA